MLFSGLEPTLHTCLFKLLANRTVLFRRGYADGMVIYVSVAGFAQYQHCTHSAAANKILVGLIRYLSAVGGGFHLVCSTGHPSFIEFGAVGLICIHDSFCPLCITDLATDFVDLLYQLLHFCVVSLTVVLWIETLWRLTTIGIICHGFCPSSGFKSYRGITRRYVLRTRSVVVFGLKIRLRLAARIPEAERSIFMWDS
jgi:hypothetical protein